jgi:hypothetical protein
MAGADPSNPVPTTEPKPTEAPVPATDVERTMAAQDYADFKEQVVGHQRMQAEFAQAALRGLTLINGGAIVALFTLLGSASTSANPDAIKGAFAFFSGGLLFALLSTMSAFFAQSFHFQAATAQMWNAQERAHGVEGSRDAQTPHRRGSVAEWFGIGAAFASLSLFIGGAYQALVSITFS